MKHILLCTCSAEKYIIMLNATWHNFPIFLSNLLRSEIAKEQSNNRTYANRNIFMFILLTVKHVNVIFYL